MTRGTNGPAPADLKKEALRWRAWFLISVAVCLGAYVVNAAAFEVNAGNAWGLSYGTAASVLMVGTAALGVRRRTMGVSSRLRLGRGRAWLHFHVYGGLVFLLLMGMHACFRLPKGVVTNWLYWLSIVVVVSGLFGLFLQRWVPKMLSSGLSVEVHYDRIHDLVAEVKKRAADVAEATKEPLIQAIYAEKVAPVLERPRRRLTYLFDPTGGIQSRLSEFQYVRRLLPPGEEARLAELERLYRTKLEIDAHYTLQSLLRYWLYSHVPVSLAALAFLIVHLASVYYW